MMNRNFYPKHACAVKYLEEYIFKNVQTIGQDEVDLKIWKQM